jgi:hypothetical protein
MQSVKAFNVIMLSLKEYYTSLSVEVIHDLDLEAKSDDSIMGAVCCSIAHSSVPSPRPQAST